MFLTKQINPKKSYIYYIYIRQGFKQSPQKAAKISRNLTKYPLFSGFFHAFFQKHL